jgi:hypothetical protein
LSGEPFKAKIPNKDLVGEKFYEGVEGGTTIVTAGSQISDISCSLIIFQAGSFSGVRETDRFAAMAGPRGPLKIV